MEKTQLEMTYSDGRESSAILTQGILTIDSRKEDGGKYRADLDDVDK